MRPTRGDLNDPGVCAAGVGAVGATMALSVDRVANARQNRQGGWLRVLLRI